MLSGLLGVLDDFQGSTVPSLLTKLKHICGQAKITSRYGSIGRIALFIL